MLVLLLAVLFAPSLLRAAPRSEGCEAGEGEAAAVAAAAGEREAAAAAAAAAAGATAQAPPPTPRSPGEGTRRVMKLCLMSMRGLLRDRNECQHAYTVLGETYYRDREGLRA